MSLKSAVKGLLQYSSLYAPVRDAYRFGFNHEYWEYRKRMARFFSQFISKGDLVFDIGANVGVYTETFVSLGAHVVAVEPNPLLIRVLKNIRPFDLVTTECTALGSKVGVGDLHLCGKDYLATLSEEWMAVAGHADRFQGISWDQKISVPISTVDALILKYGEPSFIKIDVEGFEREVLTGLSKVPKALCFEFNSEFSEDLAACVLQACFPPSSRFNVDFSSSCRFRFARWIDHHELLDFLMTPEFLRANTNGDIYVRTV